MDQLVPSAAHLFHTAVRHLEDLTEHRTHHIAVETQLAAFTAGAHGQGGKCVQPLPGVLGICQSLAAGPRLVSCRSVVLQQALQSLAGLVQAPELRLGHPDRLIQRSQIDRLSAGGLLLASGKLFPRVTALALIFAQRVLFRLKPDLAVALPDREQSIVNRRRALKARSRKRVIHG